MKKHLLFLFFQIKSTFRTLPRILLCTLILAAVVIIVGICGNSMVNTDRNFVSADIDVVLPENDIESVMAYQLYSRMDGIASVAVFHPTFEEEPALNRLINGETSAVVIIPSGFVRGIIDGTNIPGRIYLPQNPGMESLLFCSVIDAGLHSLSNVQAAIYAVSDVIINNNMGNDILNEATQYLNDVNIEFSQNRTLFYNNIGISSMGKNGFPGYYLASGFVLLMLLCGLSIIGIFAGNPPAVLDSMKTNRISKGYIRFCEFFSAGFIFSVLFGLISFFAGRLILKENYHITLSGMAAVIILIFSVVAFIMLICMISDTGLISALIIFLVSIVMMYCCGRILPSIFLPEAAANIGKYLPMKYWCSLYESVNNGAVSVSSLLITLLSGMGFLGAAIGISYLRGGKNQ